jgi:DNA-directed RNA polymerase specialized sigma24 family protein
MKNKKKIIQKVKEKTDEEKKKHYVDNVKFFDAMKDWKQSLENAKISKLPTPPVTDYIAQCFYDIADRLSHRPNFINYPYREDMVGDGIENCLRYAHRFDEIKYKNPFAYFTQIIYYAFLRRIEKEKDQAFVKYKCLEARDMDNKYTNWLKDNGESATFGEFLQNNFFISEDDINRMEEKLKKKPKRGRKKKS